MSAIDTPARVDILRHQCEPDASLPAISAADRCLMPAMILQEAGTVMAGADGDGRISRLLNEFVRRADLETVPHGIKLDMAAPNAC